MKKTGRNDPCPCGSGNKYKHCCLQKDKAKEQEEQYHETSKGLLWKNTDEPGMGANNESLNKSYEIPDELSDDEYAAYLSEFEDEDDLTDDQVTIVDDWWDKFYELEAADDLAEHIQAFLIDHPDLTPYLEIYEEPLSRLAQSYLDADQFDHYINFIRQLMMTHPQEIINAGGSIEKEIITWLLAQDRFSEIPEFLKSFQQHPLDYANGLPGVVHLFQLLNKADLILPVLEDIYHDICQSEELEEPYALLHPIIANHIDMTYDHFNPKEMVRFLKKEISVEVHVDVLEERFWEDYIASVKRPFKIWSETLPEDELETIDLYREICENYMRYLKEKLGLHFAVAEHIALRVDRYFLKCIDQDQSTKKLFNFSFGRMRKAIESVSGGHIWLDFVQLILVLNGLYYFTDYLHECGNLLPEQVLRIKNDLTKIHHIHLKKGSGNKFEILLLKDFPIHY